MRKIQRIIPDYESDLIALVDIASVLRKLPMNDTTRARVLGFTVKRELGEEWAVVKLDRRPTS